MGAECSLPDDCLPVALIAPTCMQREIRAGNVSESYIAGSLGGGLAIHGIKGYPRLTVVSAPHSTTVAGTKQNSARKRQNELKKSVGDADDAWTSLPTKGFFSLSVKKVKKVNKTYGSQESCHLADMSNCAPSKSPSMTSSFGSSSSSASNVLDLHSYILDSGRSPRKLRFQDDFQDDMSDSDSDADSDYQDKLSHDNATRRLTVTDAQSSPSVVSRRVSSTKRLLSDLAEESDASSTSSMSILQPSARLLAARHVRF